MAPAPRSVPVSRLDLGGFPGLTEEQAQARFAREGPNELPAGDRRGILAVALEVAREPMFLLLVAAGALYLAMGELGDALMLLGFVGVVMAITIVQERRTEHALEALRDLSSPRAVVVRSGRHRRIPGREVVRGDILVVAEGERVPADAILRAGINLETDESLLTGESVPVRKVASGSAGTLEAPGGDGLASLFSGTLVTAGQGLAEVLAVGAATQLGRIGRALQAVRPEATPLQRETGRMVRVFALVGLSTCVAVVVLYALSRGGGAEVWKEGLLAGIALAMAILPEEFPVVLTVFLALGAWRISRSRVLTRRMPAVETLGAATVLAVDKTGTLTLNRMTLRLLGPDGALLDLAEAGPELPEPAHQLMEFAILASKRDPFDPMEQALHAAGARWLVETEHLHPDWALVREYALAPGLPAMSSAWDDGAGSLVVGTKGAPEAVAGLCRLPPGGRALVERRAADMAARGLRVLGVARARYPVGGLPPEHPDLELEFLGLLGLEDPVRPGVAEAVAECRSAGIRVLMITGDFPATAASIASQVGLDRPDEVVTGAQLAAMDDAALAERIRTANVFARVVPEQKLRIVGALKGNGEIVAMTGDGVNDAPALKAAHIGIAMGGRGTDVAREAADLVLLDDDFGSIVAAVKLGRRIFDNIRKAVTFILAVHLPIAGLSLAPVLLAGWPLLLLPVHIVFLELVIDPSCSLVFEAEPAEADSMRRPPRSPGARIFDRRAVQLGLMQGLTALAACLVVYSTTRSSHGDDAARALTFTTLVVSFLAIILTNRSWTQGLLGSRNPAVWWVTGGAAGCLALVQSWSGARRLFHFASLHVGDLAVAVAAGCVCVLWLQVARLLRRGDATRLRRESPGP